MDKGPRDNPKNAGRTTLEAREPLKLVSPSGWALTESGKVTRNEFFNFMEYDKDRYSDIVLHPDDAKKIHQHLLRLSTGVTASTPIFCKGAECPFATRCPLVQLKSEANNEDKYPDPSTRPDPKHGKAPLFRPCSLEVELLKVSAIKYMNEYQVDPENYTEVGYINELAEIDILLHRLNMSISKPENAELVTDQVVGVGQDGTPIIQKQISPYMEQRNKLLDRKSKIVKLMVGDRQEKYKRDAALKTKDTGDTSNKMADIRRSLDNLSVKIAAREEHESKQEESRELESGGISSSEEDGLTPESIFAQLDD